jgi:hypothetical protein
MTSGAIVAGMHAGLEVTLFHGVSGYMAAKGVEWSPSPTSSTASPSFAAAGHVQVPLDPQ